MNLLDAVEYRAGRLYWVARQSNRIKIGDVAGYRAKNGYWMLRFNGECHMLHRLIWEIHNGPIPEAMQVDHIDHDRDNNAIENLRLVTVQQNNMNLSKRSDNRSGVTGVYWDPVNKKWLAQIRVHKRCIKLGRFDVIEDAIAARKQAELGYGFHPNHGK